VELQKTTEAVPDVDQLMQQKLQEETKQSTEGADFCMKEISESQKFLAVSTRYSSTYLLSGD
jgi:hypothetical protein